ncbi:hypothetical protein GOODEAATRI_000682 [Goodea atripinnis]|uniref:Uncharacterized protein n=1 Tax=Goodea atripinnis TaxID=208336 RepID=A0ABV0MXM1_9TELE
MQHKNLMFQQVFNPLSLIVADNYTPPAPITAPVMGFPVEAPQPHNHTQVSPGAPQEPSVQLLQQLPAERVEQKEIPAEHVVLKTTFDSLVQRCQLAAGDPLSHNILSGLHEISRCVASQNYQRGLEIHTQVVSSSNFSEISAFMPILKVLMTIGNKLGV